MIIPFIEGSVKPRRRPRLGPFTGIIDQVLKNDRHNCQQAVLRGHKQSIGERFEDDVTALTERPKPPLPSL